MKQNEINAINVDDYIREQKTNGSKKIIWRNKNAIKIFRRFARAVYFHEGYRLPHSFPHGVPFMGIKHYIKNNFL